MRTSIFIYLFVFSQIIVNAQDDKEFTNIVEIPSTCIKSQYFTGTCWDFSTLSFIESEVLRVNKSKLDLSEKFVARYNLYEKAISYVKMHGNLNLSQGSQAHDALHVIGKYGIVPESVYPMLEKDDNTSIHRELNNAMKGMLDGIINKSNGSVTEHYLLAIDALLDAYFGKLPDEFDFKGKKYTAKSFSKEIVPVDLSEYVELVSFENEPYYKAMTLEVPDNWRGEKYYNLPIDELYAIVEASLKKGYSVVWDGDITQPRYDVKRTKYTMDEENGSASIDPAIEKAKSLRQSFFNKWYTTDDHLMHIIGISKDSNSNYYFKLKDSAGQNHPYVFISKPYFYLNTVALMVNKKSIPNDILKKMNIK